MSTSQGDSNETVPVDTNYAEGAPRVGRLVWEALDPGEQSEVGIQLGEAHGGDVW